MISILSKAATWSPEKPFGEAFSRVFSSRLCSAQLIWTAVTADHFFVASTTVTIKFHRDFVRISILDISNRPNNRMDTDEE